MSAIDFDPTGIDTTFMLDPGESSEAPGRLSSANTVSSGVSVPNKSSQKFFNDPLSADVIILSGPRKIYVHREDLERASPYFKAMLSGRFKESTASEIKLEDDDPDAVFDMLHFIYCFHDPIKAFWFEVPNELVSLMITADKYQISKLVSYCINLICEILPTAPWNTDMFMAFLHILESLPTSVVDEYTRRIIDAMDMHLLLFTREEGFHRVLDAQPGFERALLLHLIQKGHSLDASERRACTSCDYAWIGQTRHDCHDCNMPSKLVDDKVLADEWELDWTRGQHTTSYRLLVVTYHVGMTDGNTRLRQKCAAVTL